METLQSKEQFKEWQQKEKVIFLFSADWCPDCRFIDPFMPEIEEKYSDWSFVFVDRDDFIEICQDQDIFGIPSFLAYDQGKELGRFVSKDRKTQEEIETFIEKLI